MDSESSCAVPEKARSYPMAPHGAWYGEGTYKERGGRLVLVRTEHFLATVRPLVVDEVSREVIDLIKQHILDDKELDPVTIHADGREDGRHRAHAAEELGIEYLPVIAYGDQFPDAPPVLRGSFDGTSTNLPRDRAT